MAGRFQRAVRERLNLRMAIDGPSGSGKSYTAQRVAMLLAKEYGTRVALIESENRSARKYIGEAPDGVPFEFDDLCLSSYAPTEYTAAIEEAGRAKCYGVLVIDSLSHAWSGKDGALEQVDKQGKNKFTDGWKTVTPMHNRMIEAILAYPGHVITTMRSKTEYVIEKDEKGQNVPRKIALAPVQRAGMEYEFDIYGSMDWSNVLTVTKSRCVAINGLVMPKPGAGFVVPIITWLNTGETEQPIGGTRLLRLSDEQLAEAVTRCTEKGLKPDVVKNELLKRYQVERLADLTPDQVEDFMRRRLGKGVAAKAKQPAPAPIQEETQTATSMGEQLAEAVTTVAASAHTDSSSQDAPVTKSTLKNLNKAVARFIKGGGSQDVVNGGIKKRNPRATTVADLTEDQAQSLEAAILKILDGPHDEVIETPEQEEVSDDQDAVNPQ